MVNMDNKILIHDLLRKRWSPKSYSSRPVEPEKLAAVLEAARWAPSSFNEQPWAFLVAPKDDAPTYQTLLHCLSERNQRWAQQAPVLILSVAHLYHNDTEMENRYAFHDVGLAVAQLTLQATALGLHVRQMAGFDADHARSAFDIPEDHQPVSVIALGYFADDEHSRADSSKTHQPTRVRKPMASFVFRERWNVPFVEAKQVEHPEWIVESNEW